MADSPTTPASSTGGHPVAYLLPYQGQAIAMTPGQEHVLGRAPDATIPVTNTMVSRRHCLFICGDMGWFLRDCGSRNGVLVNGQRVQGDLVLAPQDIINVAGEQWTFGLFASGQDPQAIFRAEGHGAAIETMELEQGIGAAAHGDLNEELKRAAEIQSKMLAPVPTIDGYDIAAHTEAVSQLNGDFYDVAERDDGRVQFLLGDVCGHGVHAALFGTTILKSNRLLRGDFHQGRELLARINTEACRDTITGHFATLFIADLHPASGQLVLMLAGHHEAFVYRHAKQAVERVGKRGIALGLTESDAFEKAIKPVTIFLDEGDILLQLTDGFLEAVNEQEDPYDDEGIERFLLEHHAIEDMASLCATLNQTLHAYSSTIEDDLTSLAIRCTRQPDKDLAPKREAPSALELGQQAQRRIAYHLCRSAHDCVRLQPPRQYLIGRGHEADIQVIDSHVSRRHCVLIWDDERTWVVRDLGSRNGLVINGKRSEQNEVALSDGDRVSVGPDEFTYRAVPAGVNVIDMLQRTDDEAIMATIESDGPAAAAPGASLNGAIDGAGIIDLLQYCRMTRRTGRLTINGQPGGTIWIIDGQPRRAVCARETGKDAIIALVTHSCESFALAEEAATSETNIDGNFDDLLMNIALHIDQVHRNESDSRDQNPFESDAVLPAAISDRPLVNESTTIDPREDRHRTTDVIQTDANLGKHAGKQFGQVKLGICIGRGANAEVYRGEHLLLQMEVAVKVLKAGNDDIGEKARKRLISEAQLAARVRHPRVIQVIDAGVSPDDEVFLVEEFVNGSDLGRRISNGRPLAVDEALRHAIGVVEGLIAIHQQGIIHRDLKPDNIMIDNQGEVHISDLGLARDMDDSSVHRLTRTGSVLGTPAYISPEAIRDSKNIGLESDIYSFGATLYHLLCGSPPHTGGTAYDIMQKHLQGKPVPLHRRRPEVPVELSRAVMRCLHLDPERRPSTSDLLETFRQLAARLAAAKPKQTGSRKSAGAGARKRVPVAALAIGLIVVAIVIAVVISGMNG